MQVRINKCLNSYPDNSGYTKKDLIYLHYSYRQTSSTLE
ncbi:hypothetical protein MmTuc01_2516 [Methanosarcina mazei Tuc01]|uniref:Uncharacterized protein n=1 Tax=Methanosarcina mazei Tuc01 TaxID=1236903 RepID=M1QLF0_METMZ|nr:hypothetical protein MmTuc01_2516 [Methanosarcina mazei Tuc01]